MSLLIDNCRDDARPLDEIRDYNKDRRMSVLHVTLSTTLMYSFQSTLGG